MNSYIYLIQDGKFINTNIYKIGRTTQKGDTRKLIRFSSYNKETIQKFLREVNTDIVINIEDEIKSLFVKKYKLVQGSEWFEGDCNSMISEINSIIDKHKPLVCIPIQMDTNISEICIPIKKNSFHIRKNMKRTFFCKNCDYYTDIKCNFEKHNRSKKHNNKVEKINNKYVCQYCNIKIKHQSSYSRHNKKCKNKIDINNNSNIDNNIKTNNNVLELEKLKNKLELLEMQELKNKLELELKDLKIKKLKDNSNNNINHNIRHKPTNILKSKLDNLNMNYSLMIDMNTFITNFESEKYGLSEMDAEKLLDICKNGYIEDIIDQFFNYLKHSMMKQCENNNIIYPIGKVKLPFVFGDTNLRYHFEKKENEWYKKEGTNNIENLISIIEKQVYDHTNEHLSLNDYKKRRLVNGMLKKSTIN